MEKIKIPDDFYIDEYVLAHISCILKGYAIYSNDKYIVHNGEDKQSYIDTLRDICNMYDILNEKTYFEENKYKNMYTRVDNKNSLKLFIENNNNIHFNGIEGLLEYLAENYPECIRSDDIKIALKD
jgi:hypothetical protein